MGRPRQAGLLRPRRDLDARRARARRISPSRPSCRARAGTRAGTKCCAIAGNCAAVTERSFGVPDGVSSGQFGVGLVIDFFGLAAKNSGLPVEFVYPSRDRDRARRTSRSSPARRSPEAGKRFIQYTLSDEGQALLLDHEDLAACRCLPARTPRRPRAIRIRSAARSGQGELRLWTSRNRATTSCSRCFDQIITFRHKELAGGDEGDPGCGKAPRRPRTSPQLDEARKLAWTPPVDAKQAAGHGLLARLRGDKKDDDAAKRRKTQVEEEWSSKAKANYAERGRARQRGEMTRRLRSRRRAGAIAACGASSPRIAFSCCSPPVRAGVARITAFCQRAARRLHPRPLRARSCQISLMRESFCEQPLRRAGSRSRSPSLIADSARPTSRCASSSAARRSIQTLGVLPLVMPPFVGAVAMQLLFGRIGLGEPAAERRLRLHASRSWRG